MSLPADDLAGLLARLTPQDRESIFRRLRREFPIHPLERAWNTSAEALLEAISRSSDLTQRGIRGILAEASFRTAVLPDLLRQGWQDVTPDGDAAFDVALQDSVGPVRIQIKLQRRRAGQPMTGQDVPKRMNFSLDCFVVETQRTRGGKRAGMQTRPYRFGEFDILGVSLHPSTNSWETYLFTVGAWLVPDPRKKQQIYTFQPVPREPNDEWTRSLTGCIEWFRKGTAHTICR